MNNIIKHIIRILCIVPALFAVGVIILFNIDPEA